jgi:hypothetical protein
VFYSDNHSPSPLHLPQRGRGEPCSESLPLPCAYNQNMPYLIDGHNLIPKLGLRLDSMEDEMELVSILQEFCRLEDRQVEVYFDGAPPG